MNPMVSPWRLADAGKDLAGLECNRRSPAMVQALACLLLAASLVGPASAQTSYHSSALPHAHAANVIVPQARAWPIGRPAAIRVTDVEAEVHVEGQAATTALTLRLHNPAGTRQEAELLVPVPDGAVVRSFTFGGAGKEPVAQLLPADEARRIYEEIVRTMRDPALLEFAGFQLIRTSVFPVEANGTQWVRLTYENLLEADGERVDYVLPRSESLDYEVPWKITIRLESDRPVSTVYSPTHEVATKWQSDRRLTVTLSAAAAAVSGPFRLSWLHEKGGVTASFMAYPSPEDKGGYFLLLAGVPPVPPESRTAIRREVTLVLDRSGSMSGEKLEQVRNAARQVIGGLEEGEAFNLILYNEAIELYSPTPVIKSRTTEKEVMAFIDAITSSGGTNIHDALVEALRMKPVKGYLPIVLFMTDGLPTIGRTSEREIRDIVLHSNPSGRRIFTFGVGVDVNTPLLEAIARNSRGSAAFVLPAEDVEVKVAGVFRKLAGPVLADPVLTLLDESGKSARGRCADLVPTPLPDLFEGDQLVLLGRYVGEEPVLFEVGGNYLGTSRAFRFRFDPAGASTRMGFVPRLWAARKIALLVDAIRSQGADMALAPDRQRIAADPRFKELVDEIVRLSTRFGILTEYTAFLAREGTDLGRRGEVVEEARRNLIERAVQVRSGLGSVNQSVNSQDLIVQKSLNPRNEYWDANMNRVSVTGVQQVNDRAFYRRGNQWVDSRLVESGGKADRTVEFGSKEFMELAQELAREGQQATMTLTGEILVEHRGKRVLIRNAAE
ncbi:MAG: VWA domain-containing protein [Deltaproteobacteria bacterium]|nr:VWA domain-containing protein [Deltaproteobacteria bacterium]